MVSSFADEFTDLMTATVVVAAFVGRTAYGAPTYGASTSHNARVNYQQHLVRAADGEEKIARGTAWLNRTTPVGTQDRVTLPDGSQPIILVSVLETDEAGDCYVRLDFG